MIFSSLRREVLPLARELGHRVVFIGYIAVVILASLPILLDGLGRAEPVTAAAAVNLLTIVSVVCALIVPWTVCRTMYHDRGDALVRRIALGTISPGTVVLSKAAAVALYALGLLLSSLPMAILAYLMGRFPLWYLVSAYGGLFAVLLLATLVTLFWNLLVHGRMLALALSLLSGLSLTAASSVVRTRGWLAEGGAVLAVGLFVVALSLWRVSESRLIYQRDRG